MTSVAAVAGLLGFILWDVTYVLIILKGRKDKYYGVPLLALCLNITWEFFFAVLCPWLNLDPDCSASRMPRLFLISWLVLDVWILGHVVQFGWRQPTLQRYLQTDSRKPVFYATLGVLLLLTLAWQYTFVIMKHDEYGNSLAWLTNALMSALFVRSAIYRPRAHGLSFAAGWAMLAANLAFIVYAFQTDFAEFTAWNPKLTVVLMYTVIAGNLLYLFVVWHKTKRANVVHPEVAAVIS